MWREGLKCCALEKQTCAGSPEPLGAGQLERQQRVAALSVGSALTEIKHLNLN